MNEKQIKNSIKKALLTPENKLALIPNWLSFSRVIGSYAIPIMIYTGTKTSTLFSAIGLIGISDFLDGKIARFLKVDSEEGALIDAISDKFFSINLILGVLPKAPIFIINGALESQISYINSKAYMEGKNPKSSFLGKIKTWPLSIGLGLGYLSIAMKKQGLNTINPDKIMLLSNIFSASTIPLEIINLKEYKEASQKPKEEKAKLEATNKTKKAEEKENENKQINLSLDKGKNTVLMIFEQKKEKIKTKGKQKKL